MTGVKECYKDCHLAHLYDIDTTFYVSGVIDKVDKNLTDYCYYPMTWLGTTRILYHGILQCRSPQSRDLPSVAMSILLFLVMLTLVL